MLSKITESNYPTEMLEYATRHHADVLFGNMDTCPHDLKKHGADYADMMSTVWLTHARINPGTGRTIMEEFANDCVKDKKLAAKLAKVRSIVFDEFDVIDDNDDDFIVTVRDSKGTMYRFKTKHIYKLMFTQAGRIAAAIHPWYANGVYKAAGMVKPIN